MDWTTGYQQPLSHMSFGYLQAVAVGWPNLRRDSSLCRKPCIVKVMVRAPTLVSSVESLTDSLLARALTGPPKLDSEAKPMRRAVLSVLTTAYVLQDLCPKRTTRQPTGPGSYGSTCFTCPLRPAFYS
eukprot:555061-Amphidinium_carterae.1